MCWIVATLGFSAYIGTISYSSFSSGLGSAILLLIYVHVSAIAFLLGVVVDSSRPRCGYRSDDRDKQTPARSRPYTDW